MSHSSACSWSSSRSSGPTRRAAPSSRTRTPSGRPWRCWQRWTRCCSTRLNKVAPSVPAPWLSSGPRQPTCTRARRWNRTHWRNSPKGRLRLMSGTFSWTRATKCPFDSVFERSPFWGRQLTWRRRPQSPCPRFCYSVRILTFLPTFGGGYIKREIKQLSTNFDKVKKTRIPIWFSLDTGGRIRRAIWRFAHIVCRWLLE